MKLSALYQKLINSIPGRPKPPTDKKNLDDEEQETMTKYQAHLKELKGTVPDRGPSEFGNMEMHANLDKSL